MNVGRVICALMVVPACFHPNYDNPRCGPNGECPSGLTCSVQGICIDLDGCAMGGLQFDTCPLGFIDDLTLSGTLTYDTSKHELSIDGATMPIAQMTLTVNASDVDAIVVHNVRFTAGARLRATGALPFAIMASGSITLEDGASIDVSNGGAGAQSACPNSSMPGGDNTDGVSGGGGGGGGGGAGYGAAGGKGGDGNDDGQMQDKPKGGAGGTAIAMPMGLVGGCPGAAGGKGIPLSGSAGPGGSGGFGGGALYLVAADRIELGNGTVLTAGGGGGHGGGQSGGSFDSGGGGGGSGGMILLESPHVIGPQAQVVANGGGGGEGADVVVLAAEAGKDGENGSISTSPALGGAGGAPEGADGGRGGSLEMPEGEAVTMVPNDGGGGGGGGVGFIHIVSSDVQLGTVSPAAQ